MKINKMASRKIIAIFLSLYLMFSFFTMPGMLQEAKAVQSSMQIATLKSSAVRNQTTLLIDALDNQDGEVEVCAKADGKVYMYVYGPHDNDDNVYFINYYAGYADVLELNSCLISFAREFSGQRLDIIDGNTWEADQSTLRNLPSGSEIHIDFNTDLSPSVLARYGYDSSKTTVYYRLKFYDASTEIGKMDVVYNTTPTMNTLRANFGNAWPENKIRTGYEFNGSWSPTLGAVTGPKRYTANVSIKKYTITFKDYNGTTLSTGSYDYDTNTVVPSNPTRAGYRFTGWSPAVSAKVTGDATYTAQYVQQHTITFKGKDGTTLTGSGKYDHGATISVPTAPTVSGYRFTGWSPAVPATATADGTYTAQYMQQFTVTFKDYNGSNITSTTYDSGATISVPSNPTRAGYRFTGWSPAVSNTATANATYTAQYVQQFNVIFNDYNGNNISSTTYDSGATITIPPDPIRSGYRFTGWSPTVPATATADGTYTAQYVQQHTITFKGKDGATTISEGTGTYDHGATVTVPSAPSVPGYRFTGWSPAISGGTVTANADATYTAQYVPRYTITFIFDNGDPDEVTTYDSGADVTIPSNPSKSGYRFDRWNPAVSSTATSNQTYTAQYIRQHTVTFNDYNDVILHTYLVDDGDSFSMPDEPTRPADSTHTYEFAGWTPAVNTTPTADVTYKATYTPVPITYTVKHYKENPLTEQYELAIEDTIAGTVGEPTNAEARNYTGYTPQTIVQDIVAVDSSTIVNIYYDINRYDVVFEDYNGATIASGNYYYGQELSAPVDPTRTTDGDYNYQFSGWTPSIVSPVVGEATYTAQYVPTVVKIENTMGTLSWEYTPLTDILTISGTGTITAALKEQWSAFIANIGTIVIEDGITEIGESAFENISSVQEVIIPTTVTEIDENAFACTGLTAVSIPSSVTTIGEGAFSGCSYLGNITIESGVETIGKDAFKGAGRITTVTIPETIETIGDGAFSDCVRLSNITINSGVKSIGEEAFANTDISIITIPESVENIDGTFSGNETITEIIIAEGSTLDIPANAFNGCTSLETVIIPEGVTSIGEGAFKNSGITSITIPSTVEAIETEAFDGCNQLAEVIIAEGSTIAIPDNAFEDCTALATVTIPEGVTDIGNSAFKGTSIEAVTVPSSVENIGSGAFENCESLASVTISSGVESIGESAFKNTAITAVTIPGSVESIEDEAFANCGSLTSIVITEGVKNIGREIIEGTAVASITVPASTESIESNTFKGCNTLSEVIIATGSDISIPTGAFEDCSSITTVVIPEGVTTIGADAFKNSGITSITIPSTVETIGTDVFDGCSSLAEVTIAEGSTIAISDNMFEGCGALTTISIPEGVTSIGDDAFKNTGITEITVPSTVETIGSGVFTGCGSLTEVTITEGSEIVIPEDAFKDCSSLTVVNIGEGVKGIGDNAFSGTSVTHVTIPSTVESITSETFGGCDSIESITIAEGSTIDIPDNAFAGCDTLTTVTIPEGVKNIGEGAFKDTAITEITIPATVETIGNNAFDGCDVLNTVTIAEGSTIDIPDSTFEGCGALTTVIIPEGVKSIGESAFKDTAITSVTIPSSVENIGDNAFGDCDNLTSISITEGSTVSIPNGAFEGCGALTTITIPEGVTGIGEGAFKDTAVTEVTVPSTVEKIGDGAFSGCNNLTNITITEGVKEIGSSIIEGTAVTTVTIPASVEVISTDTFKGNDSIMEVVITEGSTISIPDEAFEGCSSLTSITIPEGVKEIGEGAFKGTSVAEVTVPSSVEKIGDSAFSDCNSLTNVIISEGVKEIGSDVFDNTSVTTVTIPSTVEIISSDTFKGCDNLEKVEIAEGSTISIPNGAFEGCSNLTEVIIPEGITEIGDGAFKDTGITSIVIPASVETISENAFSGCDRLEKVEIAEGSSIKIPEGAFEDCEQLSEVIIPEGVSEIGDNAFKGTSITEIIIPSTVEKIGENTFSGCDKLEKVEIAEGSTMDIPDGAFEGCEKLTEITIPEGVTSIGDSAFENTGVREVSIPSTVETIGEGAFSNCDDLDKVTINEGGSVSISDGVFEGCTNLTDVTIPEGTTSIGDNAFKNTKVTSVTIPSTVETIGENVFDGCNQLEEVIIAEGSTVAIPDKAFEGCESLTTVIIPEGVTSIGESAFKDTGITSVTIPSTVETIGGSAFSGCNNLTDVTISEGSTAVIPDKAFENCNSLTDVTIPEGVAGIGGGAFEGCTNLQEVNIPSTVESIGDKAFSNSGLVSVNIPEGVASIGGGAFSDCDNLETVTIPSTATEVGENILGGSTAPATIDNNSSTSTDSLGASGEPEIRSLQTFRQDTGEVITSYYATEGSIVTPPANPTKNPSETCSYEFVGWTPQLATATNIAQTYVAVYREVSYPYDFNYYEQNIDDDDYVLVATASDIRRPYAYSNTSEALSQCPDISGFHIVDASITSNGDGTYTVDAYYDRNIYSVRYHGWDGEIIGTETARYGATVACNITLEPAVKDGYTYTFEKWVYTGGEMTDEVIVVGNIDVYPNAIKSEYVQPDDPNSGNSGGSFSGGGRRVIINEENDKKDQKDQSATFKPTDTPALTEEEKRMPKSTQHAIIIIRGKFAAAMAANDTDGENSAVDLVKHIVKSKQS